jgi:hypothetical protein
MKPPHARKPPVLDGDRITDRSTFNSLISGSGCLNPEAPHVERRWSKLPWVREFWQEHQPALVDDLTHAVEDAKLQAFLFRKWRKREHDRVRFLLLGDFLAGDALEEAHRKKRSFERDE